jgi:D-proline reductase (dithiol) PrdB
LVLGSARDIIDKVGVPRFAFTDLPLGNPVGPAHDHEQQRHILRDSLTFAESASHARSSVILPVEWSGAANWRETYMSIDDHESLRLAGEERRARQAARRASPDQSAS